MHLQPPAIMMHSQLNDNDVDMSGNDVNLSDLYVKLTSQIVLLLSACKALIGQKHIFKIHSLTNE